MRTSFSRGNKLPDDILQEASFRNTQPEQPTMQNTTAVESLVEHDNKIKELLSTNNGLALGEEHWTTSVPNFIIDCMDTFKSSGVSTLYTELVGSQNDVYLQNYLRNPTPENLENIRPFLADRTNRDQVLKMIEKAQSLDIRVVGIDLQPRPKQWNEFEKQMVDHPYDHIITNKFWVDRIYEDRESNPDGKFIVHGGNLHMKGQVFSFSPQDYKPKDTVPKLLSIPHIYIHTDRAEKSLGLSGNQVYSEVPSDERFGCLEIVLSKEYLPQSFSSPIQTEKPQPPSLG